MFLLYSLIYAMALPVIFPFELMKRPKSLRKTWLREKFGGVQPALAPPVVWLHAVSVGEVIAAVPFIKELKERRPGLNFVVSTITDTGRKVASERLSGVASIIYLPFDLGFILKRALKRVRPFLFIVMETEMWPNIFRLMKENGIPVIILNGRISENSFKGYMKIRFFMRHVLNDVELFCAQDEIYAARAAALGAGRESVRVTGNFKFDIRVSDKKPGWAEGVEGPVITAGSTHRGEEELILSAYTALKTDFPSLNLILAPRHPERFKEAEELLKAKGVTYINRSRLAGGEKITGSVILLDAIGELFSAYGISDIAITGGSFIERGGQNPLEPAYWSKPVICGPHMENFPFMEEFYREGGAIRVVEKELYSVLKGLLSDPQKRYSIGKKAKEFCSRNAGAVKRAIEELGPYLEHGNI